MATIHEAVNRDTSGYARMETPPTMSREIEEYLLPPRNIIQICSLPNLPGIFPSTNNIIDFHVGGKVPQFRAPLAAPITSGGSSSSTATVVTSSSSSSTTNNPATAQSASTTTSVIITGDQFQGTILLSKSFLLYKMAVNAACRVELYSTSNARSADLSRTTANPPGLGTIQGLISDVVLDTAPVVWYHDPKTIGSNEDTPQSNVVYMTVTNLSGTNQPITVTLTYIPLQA